MIAQLTLMYMLNHHATCLARLPRCKEDARRSEATAYSHTSRWASEAHDLYSYNILQGNLLTTTAPMLF
jgi:hypothetical protein